MNHVWQTADGAVWACGNVDSDDGDRVIILCRLEGERWKVFSPDQIPELNEFPEFIMGVGIKGA